MSIDYKIIGTENINIVSTVDTVSTLCWYYVHIVLKLCWKIWSLYNIWVWVLSPPKFVICAYVWIFQAISFRLYQTDITIFKLT